MQKTTVGLLQDRVQTGGQLHWNPYTCLQEFFNFITYYVQTETVCFTTMLNNTVKQYG